MGSYSIPPKARGEALVRTACILIGIGLGVGLSALVALVLLIQKLPFIFGDGHAATTDPITRYTLWLVILTAVLAAANIGLWIYAGRQASDIKQYVVATRNTASAARESAEIARTALTRGSRAFIIPKDLTFFWHPNETTGKFWWELAPIWENAGQTPTRDMRINVNSYFESSQLPADFGFPPAPGESVPLFIAPKPRQGEIPLSKPARNCWPSETGRNISTFGDGLNIAMSLTARQTISLDSLGEYLFLVIRPVHKTRATWCDISRSSFRDITV